MTPVREVLAETARLIAELRIDQAQRRLQGLARRKVPRELLRDFSGQCRQAGIPELSLRLLHPCVRPKRGQRLRAHFRPASVAETVEYAACLIWLGSTDEALGVLARLPASDPYVGLLTGANYFWCWETELALSSFKAVCQLPPAIPGAPDVMDGWATYWCAACLIQDVHRTAEAPALLERVMDFAQSQGNLRLQAYAIAALVLALAQLQRWDDAYAALARGRALLAERGHIQIGMRLNAYEAALGALSGRGPQGKNAAQALAAVIRDMQDSGFWEDARGARLLSLLVHSDPEAFSRLYFGTPHEGFRRRMIRLCEGRGYPGSFPAHYEFAVGNSLGAPPETTAQAQPAGAGAPWLDSHTGRNSAGEKFLKPLQLVQRTLWVLSSDLYQPQRTLAVFERLFPNEHVDPVASSNRVQQSVLRLRRWLKGVGLPLQIRERNGIYWLESDPSGPAVRVRIYAEAPARANVIDPRVEEFLSGLRRQFGTESFGSPEAAEVDGRPLRTVVRELTRAHESGLLHKSGAGRATRYRLR